MRESTVMGRKKTRDWSLNSAQRGGQEREMRERSGSRRKQLRGSTPSKGKKWDASEYFVVMKRKFAKVLCLLSVVCDGRWHMPYSSAVVTFTTSTPKASYGSQRAARMPYTCTHSQPSSQLTGLTLRLTPKIPHDVCSTHTTSSRASL